MFLALFWYQFQLDSSHISFPEPISGSAKSCIEIPFQNSKYRRYNNETTTARPPKLQLSKGTTPKSSAATFAKLTLSSKREITQSVQNFKHSSYTLIRHTIRLVSLRALDWYRFQAPNSNTRKVQFSTSR